MPLSFLLALSLQSVTDTGDLCGRGSAPPNTDIWGSVGEVVHEVLSSCPWVGFLSAYLSLSLFFSKDFIGVR